MIFAALLASAVVAPAQAQQSGKALEVRQSAKYGPYLVDGDGRSLYLFTADRQGQGSEAARSNCYDACATAWPPMIVQNLPKAGEAVDRGLLSTIERKNGETQVTYNGWPLYYWVGDKGQGQATRPSNSRRGGRRSSSRRSRPILRSGGRARPISSCAAAPATPSGEPGPVVRSGPTSRI